MNTNGFAVQESAVSKIRRAVESVFAPDTAAPGTTSTTPSAGHCAAVAMIVKERLGGQYVSAKVNGQSHWFNRLDTDLGWVDVDLTADQFGFEPVRVGPADSLYEGTRVRESCELKGETLDRADLLAERAGL